MFSFQHDSLSLFGEEFFPTGFSPLLHFIEIFLYLGTSSGLVAGTLFCIVVPLLSSALFVAAL